MLPGKSVQLPHQTLERENISVQVSGEHHHTVDDLRDQCHDQDHDRQDHG